MLGENKSFNNKLLILILSVFTIIALSYSIPIMNISMIQSSFIWILLVVPLYCWYSYFSKDISKKDFLFCIFPAIFLAICLKFGRDLTLYGKLTYNFFSIVKNLIVVFGISIFIFSILISILRIVNSIPQKNYLTKQYSFLSILFLFFLVWLPVLLIFWPGIYTYDANMQISQLVNDNITTHHPVIHTLLLNGILLFGKLTGSYSLAAGIHTIFQMLICIFVNAYICSKLSTFKINRFLYSLILIYYLCFPLNILTPFYITKDTLFSTFFLLLIFKFCEYYMDDKSESNKKKTLELIIIIVLVGLFRNNAIYALLATVPMLFFIKEKKIRRNLIFIFTVGSFITLITNQALIAITNAKPGMEGQMYSVPLQQLARSYNYAPESFTEKDKSELFAYVPENNIKNYNPRISDYVKSYFTLKKSGNSRIDFIKLWVRMGLKNKKNYLDAFFMLTQGYWDPSFQFPDKYYKIPIMELRSKDTILFWNFDKKSWFPKVRMKIIDSFYSDNFYKKIPVFSLLFAPGFTVWMFVFLFLFSIYKGFRDSYFIFIFLMMYYGTLILGPVALVRYIYPYMLTFPIMLVFILKKDRSSKESLTIE